MEARKIIIATGGALALVVAGGTAVGASIMPARSTKAQVVIGTGNTAIAHADFYGNAAQVLAIVVLALVWDTKYFDKEHMERFKGRLVWAPGRIRSYSTLVTFAAIAGIAVCLAVLDGGFSGDTPLRWIVYAGLGFGLGSLVFRMLSHVWGKDDPSSDTPRQAKRRMKRADKARRKGKVERDVPPTILDTLVSIEGHLSKLVSQPSTEKPH